MNILDEIIANKKIEVQSKKVNTSIADLEITNMFQRKTISLSSFLSDKSRTGIIAEFKRKSPSKGIINNSASVIDVTTAYATSASGISVLTDGKFFGGSIEDLQQARVNTIPILRKEFIIDAYQIIEAKSIGADAILLIAACLSHRQVQQFASLAKQLGLEVLLEIHNEDELGHICDEVDIVGVNNRNLKTFEVSIENSLNLINKIPTNKLAIAESGISNIDTIVTLRNVGFSGFLIGENFMKELNPAIAFANFVTQLKTKLV